MMSILAPGSIIQGAKWNYRLIREITKGDATHETTVYKATVDPHKDNIKAPQWFVMPTISLASMLTLLLSIQGCYQSSSRRGY